MAYAEKRKGALTGLWLGEVETKLHGRFKRSFDTKKAAEAYEAYVRVMGAEPPTVAEGKRQATNGRSFREIATACKAAGGPRGVWWGGKDHSVLQRLDFAIERIGDYDIDDITRKLVREKIVEDLKRRPAYTGKVRKQGTINRYVSVVSAVLTYAVYEDIIKTKPTLEFRKEADREERATVDFEVEARIVSWLEAQGQRVVATCVRWLAATGTRLGELYKLRPEQIENDHIVLAKEQTKTNRPRLVYVPPDLAREMRAIVASGSLPGHTHLRTMFYKAAKAAGSERHVVLHGLRHTLNTRMRKAGVDKDVRKQMLGHSSDEVNAGYDHVDLEDQRKAAEMVEQMRGEKRGQVVNLTDHTKVQAVENTNIGSIEKALSS